MNVSELKKKLKSKTQKELIDEISNERLLAIVNDTDGIGWGFHDQLGDMYFHYIG